MPRHVSVVLCNIECRITPALSTLTDCQCSSNTDTEHMQMTVTEPLIDPRTSSPANLGDMICCASGSCSDGRVWGWRMAVQMWCVGGYGIDCMDCLGMGCMNECETAFREGQALASNALVLNTCVVQ
ncbi:hypothetical protein J3459_011268 [Metarhizium acridum]|nr:hypothetical protein J3459_011268 [Metarhizium acridum]